MDYRIYRNKAEFDSTDYIEIGPGKFTGQHWQEGFIFVQEEDFGVAEGIIRKYFPQFDHFGMNDMPVAVTENVIADWRRAAAQLLTCNIDEIRDVLALNVAYNKYAMDGIWTQRKEVAEMLSELSARCEAFAVKDGWMCILGT